MKLSKMMVTLMLASSAAGAMAQAAYANVDSSAACAQLPSHNELQAALTWARMQSNGGFNLDMWGTVVNRDGVVCAVAFTGANRGSQWPGSRAISAQKANTANAFSLPQLALSTADLYSAVQPGGSLFGLQASNPVNTDVAYRGDASDFGQFNDPMTGGRIGGVNVFGGGLALYGSDGTLLGALGVSGDLSCADHIIAWKVRDRLGLDFVPAGVNTVNEPQASGDDNIIFDLTPQDKSKGGFGHPVCNDATKDIGEDLPTTNPIGGTPPTT